MSAASCAALMPLAMLCFRSECYSTGNNIFYNEFYIKICIWISTKKVIVSIVKTWVHESLLNIISPQIRITRNFFFYSCVPVSPSSDQWNDILFWPNTGCGECGHFLLWPWIYDQWCNPQYQWLSSGWTVELYPSYMYGYVHIKQTRTTTHLQEVALL